VLSTDGPSPRFGAVVANSKVLVSYRADKHALLEEDFPAHRGRREMILNHIKQHTLGLPRPYRSIDP
jgi:hypothetical protein